MSETPGNKKAAIGRGEAERTASAKALRLQERFRCLWKRKKAIVITAEWLSGRKDGAMQDHVGL